MKIEHLPTNVPSTPDKGSAKTESGSEDANAFSAIMDRVVSADRAAPAVERRPFAKSGTRTAPPEKGASKPAKSSTSGESESRTGSDASVSDMSQGKADPRVDGAHRGCRPMNHVSGQMITDSCADASMPTAGSELRISGADVSESAEPAETPLQNVPASVEPPTGNAEVSLGGALPGGVSQVRLDGALQLEAPIMPAIESLDISLNPGLQVASQDNAAAESPDSQEDSIPAQKDVQGDGASSGSANAVIPLESALADMGASFAITTPNSASRGNTRETQTNQRPIQASERKITLPEDAQCPSNVRLVRDPFPPGTVLIRRLANAESRPDDSTHTSGETPNSSDTAPKSKSGAQPTETENPEDSIWANLPNSQRVPVQNPFARVNTSDASILQTPPSAPEKSLADSTLWAGGSQATSQAGASDMKTLAALLTPKQSAATEPTDFLSQLTERIQMQLRDGEDIIRIQLKPSSLGRMEIRAETSSAGVIATIVTESAGVKSYLEHNLHLLQESFQDQGLKVDRINVAVQDGDWSQHSGSGQQEPRSGTGNRGESKSTGWHSGLMEDSGEELALDPATQAALRPYSTFHAVA